MRKIIVLCFLCFSFQASAVPTKASSILISAHCPYATAAAIKVAEAGGNVVDVALTALITMSVTNPSFASLGGGGFALVKFAKNKEAFALDFREVGPKATGPDFYKNLPTKASTEGGTAVAVPGLPAGIEALHKKFGKIHWSRLFDQAILLAEKGYRVTGEWSEDTEKASEKFNSAGKKYFLNINKKALAPGELFKQPQLAKLLKELRNRKSVAFYRGDAAKDMVDSVAKSGGALSANDLSSYKVKWREPIVVDYKNFKIHLMPPPSSGGVIIKTAFALLGDLGLQNAKARSTDEYHRMIELLKRSYQSRSMLGDPDFYENPLEKISSSEYLKNLKKNFDSEKSSVLEPMEESTSESTETSHLSVLDIDGNSVAMTITANGNYGSGVVTDKFGIVMNNEMDDFTTHPKKANMYGLIQGESNKVEGGKRPLSSMSPTLVTKDQKVILSLGAPGGPRIISSVFQVLYRVLVKNEDLDIAIQSPRVHHQFLPNIVYVDEDRMGADQIQALNKMGHKVESGWQGRVFAVFKNGKILEGAFDSRGEGSVSGY